MGEAARGKRGSHSPGKCPPTGCNGGYQLWGVGGAVNSMLAVPRDCGPEKAGSLQHWETRSRPGSARDWLGNRGQVMDAWPSSGKQR